MCLNVSAQTKHAPAKRATVSVASKGDTVGITAYSDTSSVASAATDSLNHAQTTAVTNNHTFTITDMDDPFSLFSHIGALGVGGVLIAVFCILFIIIILAAPFVIIALIVYWLVRRGKADYKLAANTTADSQPAPNGLLRQSAAYRETVWQRGIKNVAIGVGLIIFGVFFSNFIAGIGAILVCWGIGQCVIARTSASGKKYTDDDVNGSEEAQEVTSDDTSE